jgi:hypothetical protein
MRKTLLIAAAALAAGVISSQAQVYSQNIVGYVNLPAVAGFTAMCNPLSNNGNDSATNLFDCVSGANDGSIILTWTGTSYKQVVFDSQNGSTLFDDGATFLPTAPPILSPGKGFLFNNQAASNTFTFVGTVLVGGAGASTNVVGIVTNVLSAAHTYVYPASALPIGGGVSTVLGMNNSTGVLDGDIILIPKIIGGVQHGYTQVIFDSQNGSTGFDDGATFLPTAQPSIPVGGSFLFSNQSGNGDYQWIQSL